MNWFRKHVKTGSRLALFALAIQFALSFGHFHGEMARSAPAIQAGLADADLACAAQKARPQVAQQTSGHDGDQHALDCAICAVLSAAKNFLFAAPPLLALPEPIGFLNRATRAEFAHLATLHPAFRSRAPPVS